MKKPQIPLFQRVVSGTFWVFAGRVVEKALHFVKIIILARLLAPAHFGLMGIALLAMETLEAFTQTGFQKALIQKDIDVEGYISSVWMATIGRGIVLFGVLYIAGPWIAHFFEEPRAASLIRVVAFSLLIHSFTNVRTVYFQKYLQFSKQILYSLSGTVADFSVSIYVALAYRSVWALVFGLLAGQVIRLCISYFLIPARLSLRFDFKQVRKLFAFGQWIFGSSIIMFLVTKGDDVIVGKFLGIQALGFYQMAYAISNLPATEITHLISQVTFPAYAELQKHTQRLKDAYFKVLQTTAFLSIPLAGLVYIFALEFTQIFLGKKWLPMTSALKILALWGAVRSLGATTGPMFQATGNPKTATKLQLFQLILLGCLIFPLMFKWGLMGVALAVVIAAFVPNIFSFIAVCRIVDCPLAKVGKTLFPSVLSTLLTVGIIGFIKHAWVDTVGFLELISLMACSVVLYLGAMKLSDKYCAFKLADIFRSLKQEIWLKEKK